jgi:site-specific recombinase XerD
LSHFDAIGKGRRFRRMPWKTEVLLAINDYLKTARNRADPGHLLFQTLRKHGPYEERSLTLKVVDCLVKSLAKKALSQKRIHPHFMRHTFATTLLDNGNDLRTVQALMGYSDIRMTERYLYSTDDRKVEGIRNLRFRSL